MMKKVKREKVVILHNIRSAHNVGSIFRTADGAGVSKIFLTGYTPSPEDSFGRERRDISKVALGAEKIISWEKKGDIISLTNELKREGFEIISVEQDRNSVDYKNFKPEKKTAFIFGSETEGLSKEVLENSDIIVEIPMLGQKESLNVSVCAGVILYNNLEDK